VRAGVKGPLSAGQSRPALYGSRFTRRPGLGGGCRGQSRCINACHAATAEGTHYLASAIARSSAGGLRDGACCPSRSSERRNVIPKMASLLTILRMEDFLSRCRYRYFAHVDAASFYLYILNIIWGGALSRSILARDTWKFFSRREVCENCRRNSRRYPGPYGDNNRDECRIISRVLHVKCLGTDMTP